MSTLGRIRRIIVGRALSAKEAATEQITPVEGLSALSLDALTSVAYGPQAILFVLAAAGATALHLIFPITLAIVGLLAILVTSYRQVINAYPHGGGAYAVSRDNFGPKVSELAGAVLDRRLHLDRRGLDRRRRRTVHLRLPLDGALHGPDVPRHPGCHHRSQSARSRGERPRLSCPYPRVHLRPAGRDRRRVDPPARYTNRPCREVTRRDTHDGGRKRAPCAEGVLGRLQRPDRSGGDSERGPPLQGAPCRPREAHRAPARRDPRPHADRAGGTG